MATAKRTWKGKTTLVATNGYGGGTGDLAADEAYDYSSNVDLTTDGYEGALVFLEHDSAGTTDNIILGIFPSVDGTNMSVNPIFEIEYDATDGTDIQEPPVVVEGMKHFNVGVKTSGTTDTFDYRIIYDAWRYDIS